MQKILAKRDLLFMFFSNHSYSMNRVALVSYIRKSRLFEAIYSLFYSIGHNICVFVSSFGRFIIFTWMLFTKALSGRFFFSNFVDSMRINGFCSIPVVGLTGLFTGAVLTVQLFSSLQMFGINDKLPYIVLISLMKELAPVLCGLMIVSRVGSSMASEIGGMATNNQLDVLTSMSVNKYRFLYFPRVLSMIVAQPLLTTIVIITGIIGSYIVTTTMYDFTDVYFLRLIWEGFEWQDYFMSIVKGIIFGLVISLIACYEGNNTVDGAVGIKKTTILTVVLSCVHILILNFIITWIMD